MEHVRINRLRHIIFLLILYAMTINMAAKETLPAIGAQVFIEPGQKTEDIYLWFRRLNESGMRVCRIRMFEDYMKKADGIWDFSLFDHAFKAAEEYGIHIFATLFPSEPDRSVGGFKFPHSAKHQQQVATYIREVVTHFSSYKSMYAWVLINEPGTGGWIPDSPFTKQKWEMWKEQQPQPPTCNKGYPRLVTFDKENFLLHYNTWYLNWLAEEISKYDKRHEVHVNNHQIFENVAEYDFPSWRKFLTSLGASAHPSWHFGYFSRPQYTAALSANCSLIRSGAGKMPFWVTELQGGNNTYSGHKAFCPTKEEITQWLWTSIVSGVDGVIFWCLNSRSVGEEAGEWALLDFQNTPSDRFQAAAEVTQCLKEHTVLFQKPSEYPACISIIYTRESLWAEKKMQQDSSEDLKYEGRSVGGVMKSALSFYEILLENGINAELKEIREYDWNRKSYDGQILILSHQISLPSEQWKHIRQFVNQGGKLIVEGLTGFYDENMMSLFNTGFPLKDVFGGELKEVKCTPGDFCRFLPDAMPVHLWQGFIAPGTGEPLAIDKETVTALRNSFGKGEVVWLPSLVGLGARRTHNSAPLSNWLMKEIEPVLYRIPFRFKTQQKGILAQTLKKGDDYFTVIINKDSVTRQVHYTVKGTQAELVFADKGGKLEISSLSICPEETIVIHWR